MTVYFGFLLGMNPLPILVDALYLIHQTLPPDTNSEAASPADQIHLYFFYTEASEEYYAPIKTLIEYKFPEDKNKLIFQGIKLNSESATDQIVNEIKSAGEIKAMKGVPFAAFHLTGGTRQMAVAARQCINTQQFRYLNATSGNVINAVTGGCLAEKIKIKEALTNRGLKLENLIKLHTLEKCNITHNKKHLKPVLKKTDPICLKSVTGAEYAHVGTTYRIMFNTNKQPPTFTLCDLQNLLTEIHTSPENCKFILSFQAGISEDFKQAISAALQELRALTTGNNTSPGICIYTEEELEKYPNAIRYKPPNALEQAIEIYCKQHFSDIRWKPNVQVCHVYQGKKGKKEHRNFEVDLMGASGHYLLSISCTEHTNPDMIRSKATEVLLRTRQMGGEHSRALMLTCTSDPAVIAELETIQKEFFSPFLKFYNVENTTKLNSEISALNQVLNTLLNI